MPILTPSRRWQPPFYPFKKRSFSERLEEALERSFKGLIWGCRMCGNCLLQETAFICPMACPKGYRNGPCGGSTPESCCVDESRPCIWHAIYVRAEKMNRLEKLLEVFPPLDWDKAGTSALRDVYNKINSHGKLRTISTIFRSSTTERKSKWERFFKDIRQPAWWDGDAYPHPPKPHEPVSSLEKLLSEGKFVLTCEIVPPAEDNFPVLDAKLAELSGLVDAVNITDNASAIPRLSAFACAQQALTSGIEPVLQMTTRDRNRLSLQASLIGASAAGIRNLLLVTGDHPIKAIAPFSHMDAWDLDSIQAVWIARKLRDEGVFLDGRTMDHPPSYFLGSAAAPFASEPRFQALRAEKKINAGTQFIQTNLIFDLPRFEAYLEELEKRNLLSRVHLIAGVAPIKSLAAAKYLRQLPGVVIPDDIMQRLADAKNTSTEALKICLELIEKLRALPGIRGLHFMAVPNTDHLKKVLIESGLRE
ncbi:MAG: methylenetetrahydrofolate reductase C-terminal domain-containing protein [Brevefilum fermentans]